MAWSVTYNQDTNILGIGTMAASDGIITHARRVDARTNPDKLAFVQEAKAKAAARTAIDAAAAPVIAAMVAYLEAP